MFVCSEPHYSEKVFQDLQDIQEDLFSSLGLYFQIMDMPPSELGASAYRYHITNILQLIDIRVLHIYYNNYFMITYIPLDILLSMTFFILGNVTWKAGCLDESYMVNCPVVAIVQIINQDVLT